MEFTITIGTGIECNWMRYIASDIVAHTDDKLNTQFDCCAMHIGKWQRPIPCVPHIENYTQYVGMWVIRYNVDCSLGVPPLGIHLDRVVERAQCAMVKGMQSKSALKAFSVRFARAKNVWTFFMGLAETYTIHNWTENCGYLSGSCGFVSLSWLGIVNVPNIVTMLLRVNLCAFGCQAASTMQEQTKFRRSVLFVACVRPFVW